MIDVNPTWIDSADGPLFAWLHEPAGGLSRGAVIICAPFGKEGICSYQSLRYLADRLAERGLTALRFDYYGQGDSAGDSTDADYARQLLEGPVAAAEYLALAGFETISAVGLRFGATILAAASSGIAQLQTAVLWDPCITGRSFLREQSMLFRLSNFVPSGRSDRAEIPGVAFTDAQSKLLAKFSVSDLVLADGDGRAQLAVLMRPERAGSAEIEALGRRIPMHQIAADEQSKLLDVPSYDVEIPFATITRIVDFLDAAITGPDHSHELPRTKQARLKMPDGGIVVETAGWVSAPERLFAIRTEPAADADQQLVFVNAAAEHHIGPNRLWVEMARLAALHGVRSIRFDRSDTGDSQWDPTARVPSIYTERSPKQVEAIIHAVGRHGLGPGRTHLVGLCSGAWSAAVAGIDVGTRSVHLINLAIWRRDFILRGLEEVTDPLDELPAVAGQPEPAISPSPRRRLSARVRQLGARCRRWIPFSALRLLARWRVIQLPEPFLREATANVHHVRLLFAPTDRAVFDRQSGPRSLQHLQRSAGPTVLSVAYLERADHGLFSRLGRDEVIDDMIGFLRADRDNLASMPR